MNEPKQKRQVEAPGPEPEALREQRDRFLAFAFAASDLLLEIGDDGLVRYALGATNQLIGIAPQDLIDKGWLELFVAADRPVLVSKIGNLASGKRCGPILVTMTPGKETPRKAGIKVVFNACRIPGRERVVYCTITVANAGLIRQARAAAVRTESGLLEREAFESAAAETLDATKALGQDVELTFIEFVDTAPFRDRVGIDRWQEFCADASAVMLDGAIDNDSAGAIAEDRFGILHEAGAGAGKKIQRQLQDLAQAFDPSGNGLDVEQATVETASGELTSQETAQALIYAINKVASHGTAKLAFSDLAGGFHEQVLQTQERIAVFKTTVAENRFDFVFQPIVDLETRQTSHFEALTRFAKGESPYQTIVFAEEVGLIQDFDLACTRRAVSYLANQADSSPISLAVNLSGQSLQNDGFVGALMTLARENKKLAGRLMFEATESSRIHDLERVSRVFKDLKQLGFSMCLDDFGAGAASFQYLRALEVDFVKIDGTYTRRLLDSDRDSLLIRNLCELCRDLNIKTIAEMVELEEQVEELRGLGIHMGQGYLLGKPAPQPVFQRTGRSRR